MSGHNSPVPSIPISVQSPLLSLPLALPPCPKDKKNLKNGNSESDMQSLISLMKNLVRFLIFFFFQEKQTKGPPPNTHDETKRVRNG